MRTLIPNPRLTNRATKPQFLPKPKLQTTRTAEPHSQVPTTRAQIREASVEASSRAWLLKHRRHALVYLDGRVEAAESTRVKVVECVIGPALLRRHRTPIPILPWWYLIIFLVGSSENLSSGCVLRWGTRIPLRIDKCSIKWQRWTSEAIPENMSHVPLYNWSEKLN